VILHPGLSKLLGIEVMATVRGVGRRLRTGWGVFAILAWAGLVALVMVAHAQPELRDASVLRSVPDGQRLAVVTLFMLAMWVLTIALVDERTGQGLSAADIDQLFGAPVSDQQLLRYQLGRMMFGWVGTAIIGGPLLSYYMHHPLGGPVQALASAPLFQIPGILVHRLAAGAAGKVRARWIGFAMLGGIGLTLLAGGVGRAAARSIEDGWVIGTLLTPFRACAQIVLADDASQMAKAAGQLAVIDAALVGLFLVVGVSGFRESAVLGAETRARFVQRLRSSGWAGLGEVRMRYVPMPRFLGAAGVLAWRRWVEVVRMRGAFWALGGWALVGLSFGGVGAWLNAPTEISAGLALSMVVTFGVGLVPDLLPGALFQESERLAELRALPISALTQVVARVLALTGVVAGPIMLSALAVAMVDPNVRSPAAAVAIGAIPVVALSFAVSDTLWLWFPVRIQIGSANVTENVRLQVQVLVGRMALGFLVTLAAIPGVVVGWFTGSWALGALVTDVGVILELVGLFGLAAAGWRRFDLTRLDGV
jgi:hypothetical protein